MARSNINAPSGAAPAAANNTAPVTWRTKAGYVGTGIVIGLVIYPFVRRSIARFQPGLDKALDLLTGKAEGLAESAADILAQAKQSVMAVRSQKTAGDSRSSHDAHDHHDPDDHGKDHSHGHGRA